MGAGCSLLSLDGELRFPGPLLPCGPSLVGRGFGIHTCCWMGKLAAERRDMEAVATSHLLVMGREAQRASSGHP